LKQVVASALLCTRKIYVDASISFSKEVWKDFHTDEHLQIGKGFLDTTNTTTRRNLT
jgi:hypothetical protein